MKFAISDIGDISKNMIEHLQPYVPAGAAIDWVYADWETDGEEGFFEKCKDADVIINGYFQWDREAIDRLENCKCISVPATGYNTVDIAYAAEKGIPVTNVHEYCTEEVSYHTIALMLALQRGLMIYQKDVQQNHRWVYNAFADQPYIRDQIIGIIGFGKIGTAVAKKALGIGMKVVAYDPYCEKSYGRTLGVEFCDTMEEVLAVADVVTLHPDLNEETTHFITYDTFKMMKKKPIFINCARGAMVVEEDLIKALDEGLISFAGLDVLEDENPDPATHPLVGRDNVVLTPHAAFYTKYSNEKLLQIGFENAWHIVNGEFDKAFKIVNGVTGPAK